MFDFHCHILPGIDDGAKDVEISIAMARIAVENGTTAMIATPHVIEGDWLPEWKDIVDQCAKLQKVFDQEQIPLTLYPGAEVALGLDILDRITGPGDYCINGGNYLLTELPALEIPSYTDDFFFSLQARGITPVIAHAERHPVIAENPEQLQEWVNKGILVQMNVPSLLGRMGERSKRTAELLLSNRMVHVIGSDAHTQRRRNPNLTGALERIASFLGNAGATKLLQENPHRILHSQEIEIPEVICINPKKPSGGIFHWLGNLLDKFK